MALMNIPLISVLCACVAVVISKSFAIQPRIIGGNDAEPHQFPYSVGIFHENLITCGGVIIGDRHILSSGASGAGLKEHLNEVIAILGSPDHDFQDESTISMQIDRVYVHPRFREKSLKNDLSIFRTARQIIYSATIQPIRLPQVDLESDEGVSAVVTGWGFLKEPKELFDFAMPDKLQYQTAKTMKYGNCVAAYAQGMQDKEMLRAVQRRFRNPNIICTTSVKEQGICIGDNGSPLVSNGTLIGIVSWSIGCDTGLPDVYTKVYPHMKWIQEEMEAISEDDDDSSDGEGFFQQ